MAREEQEIRYPDYPLFKGLQKPLEFMGIQGRYIYWAAATAGGYWGARVAHKIPAGTLRVGIVATGTVMAVLFFLRT